MRYCKRCDKDTERSPNGRCRPCQVAAVARWRAKNPENVERHRAWARKSWSRRPQTIKAATRKRNRRPKHKAALSEDTKLYREIVRRDPCSYCPAPSDTVDHVDSVKRGGEDSWENYTGACGSCNSSKGTKSLLEFLI